MNLNLINDYVLIFILSGNFVDKIKINYMLKGKDSLICQVLNFKRE